MQGTHTSLVYDESGVVGISVEESPQPNDDSLAHRRMKNRDRQRRYRARKRLEAEMKHAQQFVTRRAPVLVGQAKSEISSDNDGGVLCRRDWKTEAREAHTITKTEVAQYDSGITLLLPEMKTKSSPSSGSGVESDSHVLRRRDWKAAARTLGTPETP